VEGNPFALVARRILKAHISEHVIEPKHSFVFLSVHTDEWKSTMALLDPSWILLADPSRTDPSRTIVTEHKAWWKELALVFVCDFQKPVVFIRFGVSGKRFLGLDACSKSCDGQEKATSSRRECCRCIC
jgi:hypothetical protein